MATKVRPASGISPAKNLGATLVKRPGFDKEWGTANKVAHREGEKLCAGPAQAGKQAPGSAPLPWDAIASGQVTSAQKGLAASEEQIHSNQLLGEQQFGIS